MMNWTMTRPGVYVTEMSELEHELDIAGNFLLPDSRGGGIASLDQFTKEWNDEHDEILSWHMERNGIRYIILND